MLTDATLGAHFETLLRPFFSRALEMRVADACDAQALEVKQG